MKAGLAKACDEASRIGGAVVVKEADGGYALFRRNDHVEMRWRLPDDLAETLDRFFHITEPSD